MKVGIITRHAYPNYGSLLQAYALQEAIRKLGYDVVCIDYIMKEEESWRLCFSQLRESRMNANLIKKIMFCSIQIPNYWLNTNAFRKMQKSCLELTEKYSSFENIKNLDIDIFCTGSDQVWNQIHNKIDETYFLSFVEDKKKIAYAASFGRDKIDKNDTERIRKLVGRYEYISVREDTGVEILARLGIKGECVLDPVLLFDEKFWKKKMKQPKTKEKYVLIYQLHFNYELTNIAHKLAKEKNIKVIRLTCELKQLLCKSEKVIYLPNIYEFIGYISEATYVVTDSFHGTVFSLLFHRNFLEVLPGVNQTRNENLLQLVNLESRIVNIENVIVVADSKIDYVVVDKKIEEAREKSWTYLECALVN